MTQWKDVLELGLHLVRELKLDQRDTIDRWMVFHLAELIDTSENGKTEDERKEARKIAAETILKIWERRSALPGKAYPLARYKDILKILDRVQSDHFPFMPLAKQADVKKEELIGSIYNELLYLFISVLLMRLPSGDKPEKADTAAVNALSEEELKIFIHLSDRYECLRSDFDASNSDSEGDNESPDEKLDRLSHQLLDAITEKLIALRREVEQDSGA
ncbi:MAG: hypothetical protein OXE42_04475 [Gammaproteobacteria bacterium]|nr:hypothetical protein [Gammaproteobacteria bacterium]